VDGLDLSAGSLFAGMVVSTIGLGLFCYGKKASRLPQLLTGMALKGYPILVQSPTPMLAVGTGLVTAMWVGLRIGF